MASHPIDFQINGDVFSTPELRHIFDEKSVIQRWLDFESALAAVQSRYGLIPHDASQVIRDKARVEYLDMDAVRAGYEQSRNSVIPVLSELRKVCGSAGQYVHYGATTQDVLDTGMVLGVREAMNIIFQSVRDAESVCIDMARRYAATPMVGRTHGQQALPITFGLKVAVWASELRRNIERIKQAYSSIGYGQLGGAVGTMAALGPKAFDIAEDTLARLGLKHVPCSWHTARDSVAEVASVLSILCMTLSKVANEIFHLQKTEIGELCEPPPSGASSSTMPHKQNPVICQRVVAVSMHVRALAATIAEGMGHVHERDPRRLWAEWLAMPQICIYTGAAAAYMEDVLSGLRVNVHRMYKNLTMNSHVVVSEWLMFRLAESMGRVKAQAKVRELVAAAQEQGVALVQILLQDQETAGLLSPQDLEPLERPELYTGHAEEIVRRTVQEIEDVRNSEGSKLSDGNMAESS